MLICLDMDGTLIRSHLEEPRIDYDVVEFLPGRIERVDALMKAGYHCVIVTNQGGVAFGYQTLEQADAKIREVAVALQLDRNDEYTLLPGAAHYYVCPCHPEGTVKEFTDPGGCSYRKPSGKMIMEAIMDWPIHASAGVLMVGDRPEDEGAAEDAGVGWMHADEFFTRTDMPQPGRKVEDQIGRGVLLLANGPDSQKHRLYVADDGRMCLDALVGNNWVFSWDVSQHKDRQSYQGVWDWHWADPGAKEK